jgi:LacI family transcriptional regulator
MKENKRVTLKDIARQMDVSIGTVDRAIHDRGRISPETREMVLEKLKELGYTPNTLARALGRGRPTRIAFLSPDSNGFWQDMIQGAMAAAASLADYNLKLDILSAGSEENVLGEAGLMEEAVAARPDALLVVPLNAYLMQMHIDKAAESGIRVATVNRDSPDSRRLFYYGENPYAAGLAIGAIHGKFIPKNGCAAFMKLNPGNPNFDQRTKGWRDALAGYAPEAALPGPFEYTEDGEVAYAVAKRLLSQKIRPQAVFADTAGGAIALAQAVRDAGLAGEVCVVGIDVDERTLELLDSRAMFAVIEQSPYTQGYEAVKLMHRVLMEGYEPDRSRYYTRLEVYLDRRHYLANTPGS